MAENKLGPPEIAYICDQHACENCSYPTCKHTFDIEHAINFEKITGTMGYFEKEKNK